MDLSAAFLHFKLSLWFQFPVLSVLSLFCFISSKFVLHFVLILLIKFDFLLMFSL